MIVGNNDIKELQRSGGKIFKEGKPFRPSSSMTEADLLREILYQLRVLNDKPVPVFPEIEAPVVNVPAPEVTVEPPEVNVTVPPEPRPRRWEFEITRNINGDITHITATANG